MIAGVTRHARTQREARALETHLMKPKNAPRVRILGGSLATDLSGALADMQRLRDSTKADSAALHIHVSPSRTMSDEELGRAADMVIRHFGGDGHPAALVTHEKERHEGDGRRHAHLVLGRVSPEGRVLEAGFEKIRLETAARIIEYELDEPATLGRHHTSAVRWLRNNGREDVADWLEAAHGQNPDRPQSAASPEKRQALVRQGVDLSEVRAEIRTAWKDGGAEAVREAGYSIEPGRKSGIFIVSREGVEIGSLDRITREKRADIQSAMNANSTQISRKESRSEASQRARKPTESTSGSVAGDPSSGKTAQFRPERYGLGQARAPLHGKKKSGAEQVSETAADQGRQLAEYLGGHLDTALTKAAARRWIKERRAVLKGTILAASQSPDDSGARRDVAQSRRELAVLDAAVDVLRADPTLAFGGEKSLMGAARRLHAERTAATRDEIRIAWESGGVAAIRNAGFEIEPGRNGTWRVLRDGVPLGARHRLSGEEPSDARQRSASALDAEKTSKSRSARTFENAQPSEKPIQRVSGVSTGDPSSGKLPRRHSPEEAFAAAERFLDRLETDLRSKITELACPDKLPEPAELTDARRRLSAAARERASWDDRHGSRITELRLRTGRERPTGVLAWVSGATARWDQASRELDALFEHREPLRRAKAETTRALRILQTAQETRQVVHDDARNQERERLSKNLFLVPDARAALAKNPTIANGGRKALAAAARRHQTARLAEERRAETALEVGGYSPGGFNGGG